MSRRSAFLILSGMALSVTAGAHHGPESHYLLDQSITAEGVVTEFRLINPHARIYFDVTTASGEVQHWLAEGNAAAILRRRGWTRDTLTRGDFIRITGNPSRDGGHKMDWKLIVLSDGTELRGGNTVAAEREKQLDELEQRRRQSQEDEAN
jgi:hypothetical protein